MARILTVLGIVLLVAGIVWMLFGSIMLDVAAPLPAPLEAWLCPEGDYRTRAIERNNTPQLARECLDSDGIVIAGSNPTGRIVELTFNGGIVVVIAGIVLLAISQVVDKPSAQLTPISNERLAQLAALYDTLRADKAGDAPAAPATLQTRLEQLAAAHKAGLINAEEYAQMRAKVMREF
jgi:Short C-terminal domain